MTKISVAMTTYNGEKYVVKQLDSIRNQTRRANEVIICDDCSTDSTPEMIKKYIFDNNLDGWVMFENQQNLGFTKNFYQAITKTSGDYIFLADQDDIWTTSKIEEMMEVMEENKNIHVLSCGLSTINENDKLFKPQSTPGWYRLMKNQSEYLSQVDLFRLCVANTSPGCCMAFDKKIKEFYLEYFDKLDIPHDYFINLAGALKEGSYSISESLVNYRIHRSNSIGLSRRKKISGLEKEQLTLSGINDRLIFVKKYGTVSNCPDLNLNIKYVQARMDFYKKKTISSFVREIRYLIHSSGIVNSKWKSFVKDSMILIRIIYK